MISQRISTQQAVRIQERIITEHGHVVRVAGEDVGCFPVPERLLGVTSVPGLNAEKIDRLHSVAQAALDGVLDAESLRALGHEEASAALRSIRGIGPFWSELIYLRGCSIPDFFPQEPLALAALGRLHGLGDTPSPEEVRRLTDLYSPYRMWVCFLLRMSMERGGIPAA